MELYRYKDYFFTVQRKGNDRNGNPIFLINIFKNGETFNSNFIFSDKLDKRGNIVIKYYGDLTKEIKNLIEVTVY